jgi:ABC-type glycerol-3-phosphate transport system substrate-binding protein
MARRFIVVVVLAWVVFLGLLVAIFSGSLDNKTAGSRLLEGKREKKDVVVLWLGEIMGGPSEIAGRKMIAEYNRTHKDVYINAVVMPYACYIGKINVAVATGQPPDVCLNAVRTIDQLRVKQKVPDLAVPIPMDFMPESVRRRYGPSCVAAVSRRGKVFLFPTQNTCSAGCCGETVTTSRKPESI